MNDKSLEKIFSDYQPSLNSDADFMAALETRLDTVEFIRKYQEAQVNRYRKAMIATCAVGFVLGVVATLLIFSLPEHIHLYAFGLPSVVMMIIEQNYRILSLIPTFALIYYIMFTIYQLLQNAEQSAVGAK